MSTAGPHHGPQPPKHEFLAGRLALDFCNSLSPRRTDPLGDRIRRPADLVAWARRAGIALDHPPRPPALARLLRLRAALNGIFHATAERRAVRAADLAVLNAELAEARAAERLIATRGGFRLEDGAAAALDRLRRAIARDAAALLAGDLRRVKRCPAHDCRWLFHDASRNLSRRWCAMDDCGTRAKVRRYRARSV